MALGLLLAACAATPPAAVPRATPTSFAPLVRRVLPAVVNIAVTETLSGKDLMAQVPPELRDTPLGREFRRKFGDKRTETISAGSGFIIDPSGIIVTNRHVVGHASSIEVALTDGETLPARVIGSDQLTDVAVIQVTSPHQLPAVAWGDSRQVEVGDWILAAGNPFGLGGSVTAGIVSARGRDLGAGPFDNFLQLDAPINPGNSGGPTFNMDGAGGRHDHRHRLAQRRLGRHRFRHPQRGHPPDRRRAARQGPRRSRLARRGAARRRGGRLVAAPGTVGGAAVGSPIRRAGGGRIRRRIAPRPGTRGDDRRGGTR